MCSSVQNGLPQGEGPILCSRIKRKPTATEPKVTHTCVPRVFRKPSATHCAHVGANCVRPSCLPQGEGPILCSRIKRKPTATEPKVMHTCVPRVFRKPSATHCAHVGANCVRPSCPCIGKDDSNPSRRTAVCFPPSCLKMLVNTSSIACAFSLADKKHLRRAVLRIFSVQIFAQGKEAAAENTCRIVKADDAALPEICLKKRMCSNHLCLSG